MISFPELKRSLREALVQFLWDQWVSIGLAGATRTGPVPFVVDPEALLLGTSRFGMEDARLAGEMLDWLVTSGHLLCAQKLKSLQIRSGLGEANVLRAMNQHLAERATGGSGKLLAFASTGPTPTVSEIFDDSASKDRGLSLRPDPRNPEAFLFKMRSFFGINARAEVFTWLLLSGRSGHPAWIARETGWGAKTVQVVLNEMAESGLVFLTEGEREKRFRIKQDDWQFLLPKDDRPIWWSQAPFYAACLKLIELLDVLGVNPEASDAARSVKIRGLLPDVAQGFALAKQPGRFDEGTNLRGAELVESVRTESLRLIEGIKDRRALVSEG